MVEWSLCYGVGKNQMRVQSRIIDLFVIPVGIYRYPFHEEWKKVVYEIIQKYSGTKYEMPEDKGGIQHFFNRSYQDVFRDVKDPEFLEILRDFESFTKMCLNTFYNDTFGETEYNEMLITNSWINLSREGNSLAPHFHGNSILAGNYFVNFKEDHTPLSFCNPFTTNGSYPGFSIDTKSHTPYSVPTTSVDAEEGDLIVWQAGLYHGFENITNSPKDDRITLAMNACPDIISAGPYKIKIGVYDESN